MVPPKDAQERFDSGKAHLKGKYMMWFGMFAVLMLLIHLSACVLLAIVS